MGQLEISTDSFRAYGTLCVPVNVFELYDLLFLCVGICTFVSSEAVTCKYYLQK
jgi:hypothetical protein